jgi:hypothetical protein
MPGGENLARPAFRHVEELFHAVSLNGQAGDGRGTPRRVAYAVSEVIAIYLIAADDGRDR